MATRARAFGGWRKMARYFPQNAKVTFMKRVRLPLVCLLICLVGGCATVGRDAVKTPSASTIDVKLIAFNDFHGNLKTPGLRVPVADASKSAGFRLEPAGGIEQFSALAQSLKAKNPNHAMVSAGDMVGATPLLSALFKDEPTIEAMNLVGLDFHAVGNHEFDYGIAHLKRLKNGGCKVDEKTGQPDCAGRTPFAGANFTFLAANVIEESTGKPLFPAWGVKEFEGIKVAFIGMTLRGTPNLVQPNGTKGVRFVGEVETVNALVPQIRAQGIEAIVVLLHQGGLQSGGFDECVNFESDNGFKEMVERFDAAVDVVISAHTHRYYVCHFGGKLVTSANSFGTMLTEIDLKLDRASRDVVGKSARNHLVNPDGAKDQRLAAPIDTYAALAKPLENRIVAKATRELELIPVAPHETELGNLVADAHQSAGSISKDDGNNFSLSAAHFVVDDPRAIAFNNPGSLRSPLIPAADGSITYGDLFKIQPFQNNLIAMTLTGAQVKEVLEHQFTGDRVRVMGVSRGFAYTWDDSRQKGDKVIANSITLNGIVIKPDERYRIIANSFLAGGSEGFNVFPKGTDRIVGALDVDALVNYLSSMSPYTPSPLGKRITRRN
jgi:5'-nucleotidase